MPNTFLKLADLLLPPRFFSPSRIYFHDDDKYFYLTLELFDARFVHGNAVELSAKHDRSEEQEEEGFETEDKSDYDGDWWSKIRAVLFGG